MAKPFITETDKVRSYRIANLRKYNPRIKERHNCGRIVLGSVFKDKPNKISFAALPYGVYNKKLERYGPEQSSVTRVIIVNRNGRLQIYQLYLEGKNKSLTNISTYPNIEDKLKLEKPSQQRRLARVINEYLKVNGFKERIPIGKIKLGSFGIISTALMKIIYPQLKGFSEPLPRFGGSVSKYFRRGRGIKEIVHAHFGHSSRQIVKLACEVIKNDRTFDILLAGKVWKGLLSLDNLYPIFKIGTKKWVDICGHYNKQIIQELREFLQGRSEERRKMLLKDISSVQIWTITDMLKIYGDIKSKVAVPNLKTWEEYHDWLSAAQRKLEHANQEINYNDEIKSIDGAQIDDLRLVLPPDTDKILEWGQKMHHCIFGYSKSALRGECVLFGLYQGNKLLYNGELRGKSLRQLQGPCNCAPAGRKTDEDRAKLLDFLKERAICN